MGETLDIQKSVFQDNFGNDSFLDFLARACRKSCYLWFLSSRGLDTMFKKMVFGAGHIKYD